MVHTIPSRRLTLGPLFALSTHTQTEILKTLAALAVTPGTSNGVLTVTEIRSTRDRDRHKDGR